MSRLIPPQVLSQCVRSEHHLKVQLDICMVTREVKVLITHEIRLIYRRSVRGIKKLWDLQIYTIYYIVRTRMHEQVYVRVNAHLCFAQLHVFSLLHSGGSFVSVTYSSAADKHRYPPQLVPLANLNQSLTLITSLPP